MKQLLKYILSIVTTNLQFAESKFGIIIAINSGIIVFASNYINSENILFLIINIMIIIFCCISLFCCFLGIKSKYITIDETELYNKFETNLTFYKDICYFTPRDYLNQLLKNYEFPIDYSFDEFEVDLAKQIIVTSKSAVRKYEMFNKSIFWLFLSILFIIIMFFIGVVA